MNVQKINGYGAILRFITPILIVFVGYLGKMAIDDVKYQLKESTLQLKELNLHFTNHLSEHKSMEVLLEKRLTRIETKLGIEMGGNYGTQ